MGKYEDGSVVGWIVTPPACPSMVWPRAPDGSEHIAAEDPRPDVGEAARGEIVIDTVLPAFISLHLLKGASWNDPVVQSSAADSERVIGILVRAGSVAVQGYCEVVDAELRHDLILSLWASAKSGAATLRPNENKISDGWRGGAALRVEGG